MIIVCTLSVVDICYGLLCQWYWVYWYTYIKGIALNLYHDNRVTVNCSQFWYLSTLILKIVFLSLNVITYCRLDEESFIYCMTVFHYVWHCITCIAFSSFVQFVQDIPSADIDAKLSVWVADSLNGILRVWCELSSAVRHAASHPADFRHAGTIHKARSSNSMLRNCDQCSIGYLGQTVNMHNRLLAAGCDQSARCRPIRHVSRTR